MTQYYKYPRTPHLPWSPGANADDIILSLDPFQGKEVIVTEKLDGENTSMYSDHIHARSIDSRHHPSRNWVKRLHASIAHQIPVGWRLCGENVYAQHSVAYQNLKSYFYLFSIWKEDNTCLSWQETCQWAERLQIEVVPVLYEGIWSEAKVKAIDPDINICEGYVIRCTNSFHYDNFASNIAKWVRKDHVQTDTHWMHKPLVKNSLQGEKLG